MGRELPAQSLVLVREAPRDPLLPATPSGAMASLPGFGPLQTPQIYGTGINSTRASGGGGKDSSAGKRDWKLAVDLPLVLTDGFLYYSTRALVLTFCINSTRLRGHVFLMVRWIY